MLPLYFPHTLCFLHPHVTLHHDSLPPLFPNATLSIGVHINWNKCCCLEVFTDFFLLITKKNKHWTRIFLFTMSIHNIFRVPFSIKVPLISKQLVGITHSFHFRHTSIFSTYRFYLTTMQSWKPATFFYKRFLYKNSSFTNSIISGHLLIDLSQKFPDVRLVMLFNPLYSFRWSCW